VNFTDYDEEDELMGRRKTPFAGNYLYDDDEVHDV
jgi:hypothetical protein